MVLGVVVVEEEEEEEDTEGNDAVEEEVGPPSQGGVAQGAGDGHREDRTELETMKGSERGNLDVGGEDGDEGSSAFLGGPLGGYLSGGRVRERRRDALRGVLEDGNSYLEDSGEEDRVESEIDGEGEEEGSHAGDSPVEGARLSERTVAGHQGTDPMPYLWTRKDIGRVPRRQPREIAEKRAFLLAESFIQSKTAEPRLISNAYLTMSDWRHRTYK